MVLWATSCTNMQMTSPSHRNFHFAPKYVCYNHLQFHQTTELFVQTFVCTFFRQIFSVCVFLLSGIKKIIEWNKCLLKNFCRKYVLLVPVNCATKGRQMNEWMQLWLRPHRRSCNAINETNLTPLHKYDDIRAILLNSFSKRRKHFVCFLIWKKS